MKKPKSARTISDLARAKTRADLKAEELSKKISEGSFNDDDFKELTQNIMRQMLTYEMIVGTKIASRVLGEQVKQIHKRERRHWWLRMKNILKRKRREHATANSNQESQPAQQ